MRKAVDCETGKYGAIPFLGPFFLTACCEEMKVSGVSPAAGLKSCQFDRQEI